MRRKRARAPALLGALGWHGTTPCRTIGRRTIVDADDKPYRYPQYSPPATHARLPVDAQAPRRTQLLLHFWRGGSLAGQSAVVSITPRIFNDALAVFDGSGPLVRIESA